jgi:branched-chain amino acid transport system permease protein
VYLMQLIVLGLLAGAVYGLIGVGFTLVLGIGRIPNFAQGSFVGLGLYFALFMRVQFGLTPYEAFLPGLVFFAIVGIGAAELFERRGRKAGEIGELLVGLALLLVINGLIEVLYSDNPRSLRGVNLGSVQAFGVAIPWSSIVAAIFAVVAGVAMFWWIKTTRWGRAMRAVTDNAMSAGLYGVRVPIIQRLSVTMSVVLAGAAGILISPFTVMTPALGDTFLITAFAVVLVGSIGNTLGAVVAGLAIGVIDSITGGYLASYWTTLAPLIAIVLFLLIRRESVSLA